jgi:murein DD-endopeptidase MepM/ murein hydrolase activator NlpD
VFRLISGGHLFSGGKLGNAKAIALTLFAAVSLVSACKPLLQGSDSGDLSMPSDKEEDSLERLTANQNTALKTYMMQSSSLSNESCLIPEGTQLVADAIRPEGVGHWRVFSLSEIRLPTGEVGRLTRVSNEAAPDAKAPGSSATPVTLPTPVSGFATGVLDPVALPQATPAANTTTGAADADTAPAVVSKTPKELLNCPLLERESFLVFSAHFSRQLIADPQKKLSGRGPAETTNPDSKPSNSDASWQWPTRGKTIRNDSGGSGYFNAPRASGRGHQGIDIVAAVGEAVYAARAGTIVDPSWEGAYGKVVDVQHEAGYLSRYAHLSSFTYSHGTYVEKGARIAAAGRTGNASGASITPHLHFEIRRGGRVLNPRSLLP